MLKGKSFEWREEITWNPAEELYIIPVPGFQRCYQQWHGPEKFSHMPRKGAVIFHEKELLIIQ